MTVRVFVNPAADGAGVAPPSPAVRDFHRRLPGYAPTPLVDAPELAARLGVRRVVVKDESARLGLPSFKALGASYACYRTVLERLGGEPAWSSFGELVAAAGALRPLRFAAATDGNHGRAVARMARLFGLGARILVPAGMAAARVAAIEAEGAEVVVVHGTYDEAVARSADEAGPDCAVVSDTSWPGYETVPGWVIDGYSTIFQEVDEELSGARGRPPGAVDKALGGRPDVVVVPMGVGALAAATVRHYRRAGRGPALLGVEPASAACVQESLRAGRVAAVPGPHDSIMAGLNCGRPSYVAWPDLRAGIDCAVAVDDDRARTAMRDLTAAGVVSGETGAAALAGLTAVAEGAAPGLPLGPDATVLVLSTEGATDPDAYARIVG